MVVITSCSQHPGVTIVPKAEGLNKNKCCIFLSIDQYRHMIVFQVGRGTSTSKRIKDALLPHLTSGAVLRIVHDGLHAHSKAIIKSGASRR